MKGFAALAPSEAVKAENVRYAAMPTIGILYYCLIEANRLQSLVNMGTVALNVP